MPEKAPWADWAGANRGALAAAGLTVGDVVSAAAHDGKTLGKSGGAGTTASHDVAKGGAGAHGGGTATAAEAQR